MKMWTSNLFFSIKLIATENFMGYNANVRILHKHSPDDMEELGNFFVEYRNILPEFIWDEGDLNSTQKEFLELRAQSEVEKAIFETKTAAS